jgi:ankyrin repeat protein
MNAGAAVDQPDRYGHTPLVIAIFERQTAVINSLIAHGASLVATIYHGQTALMVAHESGHEDVIQLLEAMTPEI